MLPWTIGSRLFHLHKKLLGKKLTIIGTLKKNKQEIPPIFIQTKLRPLYSSFFWFGKNINHTTLLSYISKKNKVVTLLSTMHYTDDIESSTGEKTKPELLTFYNHTKWGVNTADELKGSYSVSITSCRWPMTVFYSLLDIGGINSCIILLDNTGKKMSRRNFLKELSKELCMDYNIIIIRNNDYKIKIFLVTWEQK
jgi:hypothetical protein